jgi:hypothetical protein
MGDNSDKTNRDKATLGLAGPAIWGSAGSQRTPIPSDVDFTDPIADISPDGLKSAALYASEQTSENAYKAEPVTELYRVTTSKTPILRGAPSFVDQTTRSYIAGVEGDNLVGSENLIDKDLQGMEEIQSATDPNLVKKAGSALVGKTGPQTTDKVIRVPRPGAPASYNLDAIVGAEYPTGVIKAVVDMLQEKNIYSPTGDSPFFKGGSTDEDVATQGMFTVQRELGRFVPRQDAADPDGDSASGTRVTFDSMKKIGSAFLVRGTGDFAGSLGLLADGGVNDTLINPIEQVGLAGVDIINLQIQSMADGAPENLQKILKAATGNNYIMATEQGSQNGISTALATRGTASTPYNSVSYGQLNNFLEPFGNGVLLDATGMLYISAVSLVAVLGLSLTVQAAIDAIKPDKDQEIPNRDAPETMSLGSYAKKQDRADLGSIFAEKIIRDILRIPDTDYEFGQTLAYGIPLMFGFPGEVVAKDIQLRLATGQGLIDFALNLVMSPSYYTNYIRTIIKSGQEVVNSFVQVGSGAASQGFEKFFSSLDKLVDSKVYQFLMIAAGVGDANLKSLFGAAGVSNKETLYQTKGKLGKLSIDPKKIGKSAKSNPNISDLRAIAKARQNVTRWSGTYKNPLSLSTFPASSVKDRRLTDLPPTRTLVASKENVRYMEEAIDAEYMPFYFHDLRTNEIISLPAFVTSFDDSFTASYDNVNSYGRQDPVRIYQNTERAINLTFNLVAFNEGDFKALWYTVNKLVAMMYPQYTSGIVRTLTTENEKISFTQPFSQIPSASPLIRIRLGDLYKSNYSDTALQNLFGADSKNDRSVQVSVSEGFDSKKAMEEALKNAKDNAKGKKNNDELRAKGYLRAEVTGDNPVSVKLKKRTGRQARTDNKNGLFLEISGKLSPTTPIRVQTGNMIEVNNISKIKDATIATITIRTKSGESAQFKITNFEEIKNKFNSDNVEWPKSAENPVYSGALARARDQEFQKLYAARFKTADTQKAKELTSKFFNSKNNAIVRSFHSTRGRGLAGFISNMNFDYSQATWSISEGDRAPKMVTIAMGFLPIHDMPLGIDADNRLRALSHPVSSLTKSGFGDVYSDEERINDDKPYNDTIAALDKTRRGSNSSGGILSDSTGD